MKYKLNMWLTEQDWNKIDFLKEKLGLVGTTEIIRYLITIKCEEYKKQ